MKKKARLTALFGALSLLLAVVPAAAHEVDYLSVRNGVEASALHAWQDLGFLSVRVVEGSIALPGETSPKGPKKPHREIVTIDGYGPQVCHLDHLTVRTRVFHGSLLTDDPDGTAGIARFDEGRSAVVDGTVPVHIHDEVWTLAPGTPEDFLCVYDDEPGGERWVVDFVLLEEQSSYYYEDVDVVGLWEWVEVTEPRGKGRKKPQTELQGEVSYEIDLDGDQSPETTNDAELLAADLRTMPRGESVPYFHD